jgi:hypothetical protein
LLNCLLQTDVTGATGFHIDEIEKGISTRKSSVGVFTQPGPSTDLRKTRHELDGAPPILNSLKSG